MTFFGKGDMESFMNLLHDDVTWVFPGDKHPLSGTHKGKQNYLALWYEEIMTLS